MPLSCRPHDCRVPRDRSLHVSLQIQRRRANRARPCWKSLERCRGRCILELRVRAFQVCADWSIATRAANRNSRVMGLLRTRSIHSFVRLKSIRPITNQQPERSLRDWRHDLRGDTRRREHRRCSSTRRGRAPRRGRPGQLAPPPLTLTSRIPAGFGRRPHFSPCRLRAVRAAVRSERPGHTAPN